MPKSPTLAEAPLSLETAKTLCKASLQCACLFQSYISVSKVPTAVYEDLLGWWQQTGCAMLSKADTDPEEDEQDCDLLHQSASYRNISKYHITRGHTLTFCAETGKR